MAVLASIIFSSSAGFTSFAVAKPTFSVGYAYNLSTDSGKAQFPMAATSGSHVYVTWTEGSGGIMFRANSQEGAKSEWVPALSSPAMKISNGSGVSSYPEIQANNSNVYIAWAQGIAGVQQIMLAYSHNYGQNFSTPIQMTHSSAGAITPVLAGYGSNVYVAYFDKTSPTGSYVNSSTNAGISWTSGFKYSSQHEPQLAAWGSNAYATADGALAVSNNNGSTWTKKIQPGSESWIAAYGSNVYVAWETKGTASEVQAQYSSNNGSAWSNVYVLSKNYPDAWAPMVSAYGNTVYVAFHTHPGSPKAKEYIVTSSNYWATNTTKEISSKGDASWPFDVAAQGSDVFIMWSQKVSSTAWNPMVAYSTNAGATWPKSPPAFDLSNNGSNSQISPENDIATGSIASFGNMGFAAWQNASVSASYSQIYFGSSS